MSFYHLKKGSNAQMHILMDLSNRKINKLSKTVKDDLILEGQKPEKLSGSNRIAPEHNSGNWKREIFATDLLLKKSWNFNLKGEKMTFQ